MEDNICLENIIFSTMHKIDSENNYVEKKKIGNKDIEDYLRTLIKDILGCKNYKYFKVSSMKTEVNSQVFVNVKKEKNDDEDIIVNRYLKSERIGRNRAQRLGRNVRKGYLIQSLFLLSESYYYVISKVEIDEYLDDIEFMKRLGLPYSNQALKTCIYKFNEQKEMEEIYITDKLNSLYWYGDFLELEECSSNEKSTKDVFDLLDRKIRNGTKKSASDYYALRNNLVAYFQSPRDFFYDDMEHYVFDDYVPDHDIDMERIRSSVENTLKCDRLDTVFKIVPAAIITRLNKRIKINSFVTVQLVGGDENYSTKIYSFKKNERKYIGIEADDEAYEIFLRKDQVD